MLRLASGRRAAQRRLSARRQLVGVSQQQTHLPKLLLAHGWTVRGHASEPDAIFCLPVGLAGRVIRHTVSLKELRRLREHAFCGRSLGLPVQAVAYRTVLPIELRA